MCVCVCVCCYPQRDCFVVPHPFSVARHVRQLNLGLKTAQLYVRLIIIPLCQQANHDSSGIIGHYNSFVYIFALTNTRVLNSFKELCIM